MLKKITSFLIILSVFLGTANGLGMTPAGFSDVEQGKNYTIPVAVQTSNLDFDNHFVIEIEGKLKDWVIINPMEFDLPAGKTMILNVSLKVPEDAKLGKYNGSITAIGQKPVPSSVNTSSGTGVGYTIAARSILTANVIKPGAVESIEIISLHAPGKVKQNSPVRFDVTLKNTGNVPTTVSSILKIRKGANVIEIPGAPVELSVSEEKTIKLYWDTQENGEYTAVVAIAFDGKTVNSEPVSIVVSNSLPGFQAFAVVLILLVAATLIKRKR